jgi:dTDP-D-glucose 4,6-dehydratase
MKNNTLAQQFARLSEIMSKNGDNIRARVYSRVEEIILGFPTEIKSVDELKGVSGIGTQVLDKIKEYVDFSCSRIGQDVRYALDDSKLRTLGWKPKKKFYEELKFIVDYYKNKFIW